MRVTSFHQNSNKNNVVQYSNTNIDLPHSSSVKFTFSSNHDFNSKQ